MPDDRAEICNVREAVPFFAVAEVEASLRFYVDGLGFRLEQKWIDRGRLRWCMVRREGAAVMLQQFATEGRDSWRAAGPVGEGVRICFMCTDAIAIYEELRSPRLDPTQPVVANGLWVTSITDPDGYRLDFESPTDALEDSRHESGPD